MPTVGHQSRARVWEVYPVASVADNTREEIAVADNARRETGKEVAVADDNLVPRTGTEFAGYNQVVAIVSGEAGRIGTHAAGVDAYVPSLALFPRDRWVVPGRERVSGNLTASDSESSLRFQIERKEAHVNEKNVFCYGGARRLYWHQSSNYQDRRRDRTVAIVSLIRAMGRVRHMGPAACTRFLRGITYILVSVEIPITSSVWRLEPPLSQRNVVHSHARTPRSAVLRTSCGGTPHDGHGLTRN